MSISCVKTLCLDAGVQTRGITPYCSCVNHQRLRLKYLDIGINPYMTRYSRPCQVIGAIDCRSASGDSNDVQRKLINLCPGTATNLINVAINERDM